MNWNVPEALKTNAEPLYQSAETWNISVSTDLDIKSFTVYNTHTRLYFLYHTKSSYFHFTVHTPHTPYSEQAFAAAHFKHTCSSYIEEKQQRLLA